MWQQPQGWCPALSTLLPQPLAGHASCSLPHRPTGSSSRSGVRSRAGACAGADVQMPGVQYPQQPQGWGPSLGAQQPQPPPGFGGMPAADVSATGMTWTPSADGGGLLWDGKSWNHAAASSTNPAQLIESTKADVADAVAVRSASLLQCTCYFECRPVSLRPVSCPKARGFAS